MSLRIAIVGYGRMGRAVEQIARERGHEIHSIVRGADLREATALWRNRVRGADVAIEFTSPGSAPGTLRHLIEVGVPTVTGTTGWSAHLTDLARLVESCGGALLHSPNFSVGVQLFLKAAEELARRFRGRTEFDAFIVEEHHRAKVDAPSGTALRLQQGVRESDPERSCPITSIRAGAIPGTHALTYDAAFETVRLEHVARSRTVFAAGAVAAAEWLPGRRGVFTFEEMLFGRSS
jgi:4-hydroxy-tetrahydrodipicolinate reductase